MTWQNAILLLIGGVIGFVFKILYGKIFEKKVKLYFELDKPAFFSVIPPNVCFQGITIWNDGNLPAYNIMVTLDNNIIKEYNVSYKSSSEETHDENINDTFLMLKFVKLRPKEKFTIYFKSEKPLPQCFLINVKSDEMIACDIAIKIKSYQRIDTIFKVAIPSIAILVALFFIGTVIYSEVSFQILKNKIMRNEDGNKQFPFSLKMIIDKNIYMPGQNMEITYQATNISTETLKDIRFILEIPGIELDYNTIYQKKHFLKAGEQVSYKKSIRIPNDFPNEKHKATLKLSANSNDSSFRTEDFVYFEVQ